MKIFYKTYIIVIFVPICRCQQGLASWGSMLAGFPGQDELVMSKRHYKQCKMVNSLLPIRIQIRFDNINRFI